jgi:hypothetical protein
MSIREWINAWKRVLRQFFISEKDYQRLTGEDETCSKEKG